VQRINPLAVSTQGRPCFSRIRTDFIKWNDAPFRCREPQFSAYAKLACGKDGKSMKKGGCMLYIGSTKGVKFPRSFKTYLARPLLQGQCRYDKQKYFRLDGGLNK
jgi:hypothetical protein